MKVIIFLTASSYRAQHFNNLKGFHKFNSIFTITVSGYIAIVLEPFLSLLSKNCKALEIVYSDDDFPFRAYVKRLRWNNLLELGEKKILGSDFYLCNRFDEKYKNFQIYPLNIAKPRLIKNKIVFIGDVNINVTGKSREIWQNNRDLLLSDLNYINSEIFWLGLNQKLSIMEKDLIYTELTNLLRYELVSFVKSTYKNFILLGSSWEAFGVKSGINYKAKLRKELYSGAICLDFGNKSSGNALFQRSIEIIESGGLLLQASRKDSFLIFGEALGRQVTFKNKEELNSRLNNLLLDKNAMNNLINKISSRMSDLRSEQEVELKKFFLT